MLSNCLIYDPQCCILHISCLLSSVEILFNWVIIIKDEYSFISTMVRTAIPLPHIILKCWWKLCSTTVGWVLTSIRTISKILLCQWQWYSIKMIKHLMNITRRGKRSSRATSVCEMIFTREMTLWSWLIRTEYFFRPTGCPSIG